MIDPARAAAQLRFDAIAAPYSALPDTGRIRMFGSNALTVHGRIAGFVARGGRLVVKLPQEAIEAALLAAIGERMRMRDRPMREWLAVPAEHADRWPEFVGEAVDHVRSTTMS